eukprot:8405740-Alexandrium_andersonii.AAC.1
MCIRDRCLLCGRFILGPDADGTFRCRLCGAALMLHRVLRAHGCALAPRECAAFEAAVWGVIRGI